MLSESTHGDSGTRWILSADGTIATTSRLRKVGADGGSCEEERAVSSPKIERFLAEIYVDSDARERFLRDPQGEAARAGLSRDECLELEQIDRVGLGMAARSYAVKRSRKTNSRARW